MSDSPKISCRTQELDLDVLHTAAKISCYNCARNPVVYKLELLLKKAY